MTCLTKIRMNPSDSTPVSEIKNLGPASRKMLADVDVSTVGDIRKLGLPLLFRILKGKGTNASMNLIYALEAGLRNIHWLELTTDEKNKLRRECIDD